MLDHIFNLFQDGANGPFASLVRRPLQLGDDITLVVKSNDMESDSVAGRCGSTIPFIIQQNLFSFYSFKLLNRELFVHTCYASDGGERRVLLIDQNG